MVDSDRQGQPIFEIVNPNTTLTLEQMPLGESATVSAVSAPEHAPEWKSWLEEIGFIAGERVSLMAKGVPGDDPLMIRVGTSTFALRRAEAACVQIVMTSEAGSHG